MEPINFKKQMHANLENAVGQVTELLKGEGFGVLTRIDLHSKIKEKINKDIQPTVILGACNPTLAYEAYQANSDVASLLPCNVVLREMQDDLVSVEVVRPSFMIAALGDSRLSSMALDAENRVKRIMDKI